MKLRISGLFEDSEESSPDAGFDGAAAPVDRPAGALGGSAPAAGAAEFSRFNIA